MVKNGVPPYVDKNGLMSSIFPPNPYKIGGV